MSLRSLLFDQLWLKIFSLVLAMLIWLAVRGNLSKGENDTVRKFRHLPVMLLTDANERRALVVEPEVVDVTVRGPAGLLDDLSERDIEAFVRVQGGRDMGTFTVEIHTPPGVHLFLLTPGRALVRPVGAK